MKSYRWLLALLGIVAVLAVTAISADARVSGSSGSRGSRTYSAPAGTATAPRAAPMERSMTQAPRPGTNVGQATQTAARPGGMFGGMLGGGLLGGLAAGFLGAGLFGMLTGSGFMGGMGGFASILGLLIQVVLVVIVARLAWSWWQRRNQPSYAQGPAMRDSVERDPRAGGFGGGLGGMMGGLGGGAGGNAAAAPADQPIEVLPADYDTFERLLTEVQTAYGREDLNELRARMTPEMFSYFNEELARNASRGVINQIADIKLLQGDLSEAWREGQDEFATVAMRYTLNDKILDRATSRVVEEEPAEATEFWTFRRVVGGQWQVSAIQQTS